MVVNQVVLYLTLILLLLLMFFENSSCLHPELEKPWIWKKISINWKHGFWKPYFFILSLAGDFRKGGEEHATHYRRKKICTSNSCLWWTIIVFQKTMVFWVITWASNIVAASPIVAKRLVFDKKWEKENSQGAPSFDMVCFLLLCIETTLLPSR